MPNGRHIYTAYQREPHAMAEGRASRRK
jgi:hypothetical protein